MLEATTSDLGESRTRNLSPDLLRTFVAVADEGGFTRAARLVHRTQAAVSMQIKRLERELGVTLFERRPRDVVLAPGGQSLLPYARRMLRLQDEAIAAVAGPGVSGLIRLGSPDDYAARFLPRVLERFALACPLAQVYMRCEPGVKLLEDLKRGELDLVVTTCTESSLQGEVVAREPVRWVASRRHLAHETDPLPLAAFHRGCFYREWAEQALIRVGREYRIAYVSPSLAGIQAAVRSGLAVAALGASTIPEDVRTLSPGEGFPDLPEASIILYRRAGTLSRAAESLAEHVAASFAELQAR